MQQLNFECSLGIVLHVEKNFLVVLTVFVVVSGHFHIVPVNLTQFAWSAQIMLEHLFNLY